MPQSDFYPPGLFVYQWCLNVTYFIFFHLLLLLSWDDYVLKCAGIQRWMDACIKGEYFPNIFADYCLKWLIPNSKICKLYYGGFYSTPTYHRSNSIEGMFVTVNYMDSNSHYKKHVGMNVNSGSLLVSFHNMPISLFSCPHWRLA